MVKITSLLTKHFKQTKEGEAAKEEFLKAYPNVTHVTDVLKDILEADLRKNLESRVADYDSPSWAYKEADRIGYIRALRKAIKLLP